MRNAADLGEKKQNFRPAYGGHISCPIANHSGKIAPEKGYMDDPDPCKMLVIWAKKSKISDPPATGNGTSHRNQWDITCYGHKTDPWAIQRALELKSVRTANAQSPVTSPVAALLVNRRTRASRKQKKFWIQVDFAVPDDSQVEVLGVDKRSDLRPQMKDGE
ncbi:hypothetical protein C8R45DRAFT_936641 [Mycena sanguinolenta]|nr:hypothetical protein C8R45DRAFT_936641 [Mycena sanguinolenta]